MDETPDASLYADASYSYDYSQWNQNASGVSMDFQDTGAEQSLMSGVGELSTSSSSYMYQAGNASHVNADASAVYDESNLQDEAALDAPVEPEYTEEQLEEMCMGPLELDSPTDIERRAMKDPLFGRVYTADIDWDKGRDPRTLTETVDAYFYDAKSPIMHLHCSSTRTFSYATICFPGPGLCGSLTQGEIAIERERAMADIGRFVAALAETEIFDSLPSFSSTVQYDTIGSALRGRPRGGGSVQGPSVVEAIDVDKLLAEMGAGPGAR